MLERYYQILGIKPDADEKTLKKAFRALALKHHPDVSNDPDAKIKFQELCEAYEVVLQQIHFETTTRAGGINQQEEESFSYEEILRDARQKAYERAKMKYDKMKAEKEFFEEGSLRDLFLLFKYFGRVFAIPLAAFLIIFPLIVAIKNEFQMFFALFFFWVIGGIIINQIITNRRTWFKLGKFRWKLKDFYQWFDFRPVDKDAKTDCYYCTGEKATGRKFIITLLKVKDVKIRNDGVYQHYVAYNRKYKDVVVARSTKAFAVHYMQSAIKILSLLSSVIWLPFPSMIWRLAGGLVLGLILSNILCFLTSTRSKVSYLLNSFLLLKIILWGLVMISQTTLYPGFIFDTTDFAPVYLVFLLIFGDMFMDLIFRQTPFYINIYLPITKQSPTIINLYKNGFQNYLDIPVWSTIYPLIRWFV